MFIVFSLFEFIHVSLWSDVNVAVFFCGTSSHSDSNYLKNYLELFTENARK